MSDVAVSVQGLGKRYRVMHQQARYGRLTESVTGLIRTPWDRLRGHPREDAEWFWALQDVNFELEVGEVLGIIGRNGAGKSTLLKILSRVTEPTEGRAETAGRVASLLEVGTGFHPELTGRENIYLSGSILGMRRDELTRRFDEIVEFAGVGPFLDTPVKRYSSGMQVRLGFAVAAHLEPEILIVDEVLAVGDAAFQRKCIGKLGDVASEGRSVLVVSHNMAVVERLCTRGLLLDQGNVIAEGTATEVIRRYMSSTEMPVDGDVALSDHEHRLPGMDTLLSRIRLLDKSGRISTEFAQGEPVVVEIEYDATGRGSPLAGAGIIITSASGVRVGGYNTYMSEPPPHAIAPAGVVRFIITDPVLTPGAYWVTASLGTHPTALADKVEHALGFIIEPRDIYATGYLLSPDDGVVALRCEVTSSPSTNPVRLRDLQAGRVDRET